MGIEVKWNKTETNIICLIIEGEWTWTDYYEAMEVVHEMLDTSSYDSVDYIVDMQNSGFLPSNILSNMQRVSKNQHPKSGVMIVVGAGKFPEMMFNIMEKITPDRMQQVKLIPTLEDAHQYLKSRSRE